MNFKTSLVSSIKIVSVVGAVVAFGLGLAQEGTIYDPPKKACLLIQKAMVTGEFIAKNIPVLQAARMVDAARCLQSKHRAMFFPKGEAPLAVESALGDEQNKFLLNTIVNASKKYPGWVDTAKNSVAVDKSSAAIAVGVPDQSMPCSRFEKGFKSFATHTKHTQRVTEMVRFMECMISTNNIQKKFGKYVGAVVLDSKNYFEFQLLDLSNTNTVNKACQFLWNAASRGQQPLPEKVFVLGALAGKYDCANYLNAIADINPVLVFVPGLIPGTQVNAEILEFTQVGFGKIQEHLQTYNPNALLVANTEEQLKNLAAMGQDVGGAIGNALGTVAKTGLGVLNPATGMLKPLAKPVLVKW